MRNKNKGFTLIELLVVISIIGLLSTIAMVSLKNSRTKSRDVKRLSDLKQISTALDLYYEKYERYPNTNDYGENHIHSWDYSTYDEDGDGIYFLDILIDEGLMGSVPIDPINSGNYRYNYRTSGTNKMEMYCYLETEHPARCGAQSSSIEWVTWCGHTFCSPGTSRRYIIQRGTCP